MLNKLFGIPTSLNEYNDYVFGHEQLEKLKVDTETYKHGESFNKLIKHCEDNDIDWYIFTNAHVNWVEHFSKLMDIEIKNEKIIWPTDLDLLKPNMLAYERVESTIPNSSFVMVDDSKLNLEIPMKKPWNWKAVHFEEFHDVDYIIKKL